MSKCESLYYVQTKQLIQKIITYIIIEAVVASTRVGVEKVKWK